jgi:hypothetical protein
MPPAALLTLGLLMLLSLAVNVTSILMEQPEGERRFAAWEPLVWELSSGVMLLLLSPLVWRAMQRWPPAPPWWKAALVHLAATIPFSLLHVGAMGLLRLAAYAAAGQSYAMFDAGVLPTLVYEWRKDLLSYLLIAGLCWVFARARRIDVMPAAPAIQIRVDGRTLHLLPTDIRLVEAAGNYVEFDAFGRRHLSRMTLASAEALLGPAFVRVHRSRLVNRSLIRAEHPQPSGDVVLELADGSRVTASRRFRDRLPSASPPRAAVAGLS